MEINSTPKIIFILLAFSVSVYGQSASGNTSVYSDLTGKDCRTIHIDKESGSSVQKCGGTAGYHLLVYDDDARESIGVVTPAGKKYDLDFWNVITSSFSSVGKVAEWRMITRNGKSTPVGLIVRVDATESDDKGNQRKVSYLAVSKITPTKICVVEKLNSSADANSRARDAADNSADKACLKP